METLLPITYLNDFIFCPYSIYLHQVFDLSSEDVYSAMPQQNGKVTHTDIDSMSVRDEPTYMIKGIYVVSTDLGVYGKIDTLDRSRKALVEKKYAVKTLYQGYIYQIWAQYFCLVDMGYEVEQIEIYSVSDRKTHGLPLPRDHEYQELKNHVRKIADYDFHEELTINIEKCKRCIYAPLCDKTDLEHVYA